MYRNIANSADNTKMKQIQQEKRKGIEKGI